jgi:hypothetical protein
LAFRKLFHVSNIFKLRKQVSSPDLSHVHLFVVTITNLMTTHYPTISSIPITLSVSEKACYLPRLDLGNLSLTPSSLNPVELSLATLQEEFFPFHFYCQNHGPDSHWNAFFSNLLGEFFVLFCFFNFKTSGSVVPS